MSALDDLLNDLGGGGPYDDLEPVPPPAEEPAARKELETAPGAPAVPAAPEGPFGIREVAARFGPSRSTVLRLLAKHPAPIVLGSAERTISRWPDESAYRTWLAVAQRKRVPSAAPAPAPAAPKRKKSAPVSAGGVVDWAAAARALKPSRR